MKRSHLFTDADNTLWDTNVIFADAQFAMLKDLENLTGHAAPAAEDGGLAFVRAVDQRIAAMHRDDLRYPPSLLAHGLELALLGYDPDMAAASAVAVTATALQRFDIVVDAFLERLRTVPQLRYGVLNGLAEARNVGVDVTIVTETSRNRCEQILDSHDITRLVQDIVCKTKTPGLYRELRRRSDARDVLMVGDQLDRDMVYAHEARFKTFFFPSEFVPYWHCTIQFVPDYQIARYDEIIPHLN